RDGLVLIAGGVGIAPMMSMLRTLSDRADQRPVLLIYGTHGKDELVFRDELQSLEKKLRLQVVCVLERPTAVLACESGRIGEDLLKKYLPVASRNAFQYFICGPGPMMDVVERCLGGMGIRADRIHS